MKKITYYYFALLIIFLPLQSLFSEILLAKFQLGTSTVFWISHWYEFVLAIFCGYVVFLVIGKKRKISSKIISAQIFILLSLFSVLFVSTSIGRGLEAFRITSLALVFMMLSQNVIFSKKEADKLIKIYIITSIILSIWALVERLLPLNYWASLGLSGFGWGKFDVVGTFQSSALMPGPNQLASYLLPALFITFNQINNLIIKTQSKIFTITQKTFLLALPITAIIFSFSRSALLSLAITLLIYALIYAKRIWQKVLIFVIATATIICAYLFYQNAPLNIKDLYTHGASQFEHQNALKYSLDEITYRFEHEKISFLVGKGLGTAGPTLIKYGGGILPESWYLQLVLELGLFGVIIWLWLIVDIFVNLKKQGETGLRYGLVAVSIAAVFLHTWADNPALAITLFTLIGVTLSKENKKIMQRGNE